MIHVASCALVKMHKETTAELHPDIHTHTVSDCSSNLLIVQGLTFILLCGSVSEETEREREGETDFLVKQKKSHFVGISFEFRPGRRSFASSHADEPCITSNFTVHRTPYIVYSSSSK